jgi:hypothetical protein
VDGSRCGELCSFVPSFRPSAPPPSTGCGRPGRVHDDLSLPHQILYHGVHPHSLDTWWRCQPWPESECISDVRWAVTTWTSIIYGSACFAKLQTSGWAWVTEAPGIALTTARSAFKNDQLQPSLAQALYDYPWVWQSAAGLALLTEGAALLMPFVYAARILVPPMLAGMHAGILALMGINFMDAAAFLLLLMGGRFNTKATFGRRPWLCIGLWFVFICTCTGILPGHTFLKYPIVRFDMFSRHSPPQLGLVLHHVQFEIADGKGKVPVDMPRLWPPGARAGFWDIALAGSIGWRNSTLLCQELTRRLSLLHGPGKIWLLHTYHNVSEHGIFSVGEEIMRYPCGVRVAVRRNRP